MGTDHEFLVGAMGLTEEEAFLLLRVAARGRLTAAAAARLMDKSRGRAYELLRGLAAEGFVEERPGRPLYFVARPLGEAVKSRRAELEARLAALRQAESAQKAPAQAPAGDQAATVSLVWGIRAVNKEAVRMAQATCGSFVVAGSSSFLADSDGFELLLGAAAEAKQRGVQVRFYLADRPDVARLRQEVDRAMGPAHLMAYEPGRLPDMAFFVADGQVLHCLPRSHGEDEAADDALGIKVRGPFLPEFTQAAIQVLLVHPGGRSVDEAFAEFKSLVSKASRAISTLAGQGWQSLRPKEDLEELALLYAAAERRGVAIRTVLHDDGSGDPAGPAIGSVRHHRLLPMWLAVVDDAVVFQVFRDEAGQLMARLSSDGTVVRLFQALFEHSWMDARPERTVPASAAAPPRA